MRLLRCDTGIADPMPVATERFTWAQRVAGVRGGWRMVSCSRFVGGGIYTGLLTATESAAVGAVVAFIMAVPKHGLDRENLVKASRDTAGICAIFFLILVATGLLSQFIAVAGLATGLASLVSKSTLSGEAIRR